MLSYSNPDPQNKVGICSSCKNGNRDSDKVNNLRMSPRTVDLTMKPTACHFPVFLISSYKMLSHFVQAGKSVCDVQLYLFEHTCLRNKADMK